MAKEIINSCYVCHVMWNANKGAGTTKTFKALLDTIHFRQVCRPCMMALTNRIS